MERVIGEYAGFTSAQSAVRGLEQRGISIQNVVIVDRDLSLGKRLHLENLSARPWHRFLVVMRGEKLALASAAELLAQLRTSPV